MFKKFLILLVSLIFLVGCVPPQEGGGSSVVLSPTAKKVGYLVNVRTYPTHTHLGTTALTNFKKNYPFPWGIPAYIEKQLAKRLESFAGVRAVNLRKEGISPREINGLVKNVKGVWMVASGKSEVYKKLANRLGLSAIVLINEGAKQAVNDCGILGCKKINAEGYGVVSQSFVNSNKFYSSTAFFAHLYTLKPLASLDPYLKKINQSDSMTMVATSVGAKVKPNKIDFVYPKSFNNWTEQELKPFRAPLMKYIENMSQLISELVRDKV